MSSADNPPKPFIYEESSQYQHWRFSPEQLWDIREKNAVDAVNRVKRNLEEEGTSNPQKDYLSAKDGLALCRFYEKQLQGMCRHCKFPDRVMATAVIYMKRFFLYNNVMDYHPKDIFLTCLFLATKSESQRISIEDFGSNLRLPSTANVLNLEFNVSQGLKFQFYIHHPYRPAYGFFLDMQNGPVDMKQLRETYSRVNQVIADILLTDLPFIYQPSQLALAAFMIAGSQNAFDSHVTAYITTKFNTDAPKLLSMIQSITTQLKETPSVTHEEAKNIDFRLKLCMNPAMNPESAM
ncbi:cyclin-like protein [Pilobolus umbonatus]|nr:cyclin-like protein [Pilobolus umbonatus]